jgi:hypothetical protein
MAKLFEATVKKPRHQGLRRISESPNDIKISRNVDVTSPKII